MVAIKIGPSDDAPLRTLIASGHHREALALCTREHGAALGRFCMAQLGHQGEAEDTVQEALLAAYQAFPQYRGEGSARAWLFGIARRLCARRLTKRTRRKRRLELVSDAPSPELPDQLFEKREQARRVRLVLAELKPSDREVLLFRFEGQLPYREIGELLGIDEAAARKRVSRALLRFRERSEQTLRPAGSVPVFNSERNGGRA